MDTTNIDRIFEATRKSANESFAVLSACENHKHFHKCVMGIIADYLKNAIIHGDDGAPRSLLITLAVCYMDGYFHAQFDVGPNATFQQLKSQALDYIGDGLRLLVQGIKDPAKAREEILSKMTPEERARAEEMFAEMRAAREDEPATTTATRTH